MNLSVDLPNLGEYSAYIWLSYAVAASIMLWLLWRTVKELNETEATIERLQNISGASLASHYSKAATSHRQPAEEC